MEFVIKQLINVYIDSSYFTTTSKFTNNIDRLCVLIYIHNDYHMMRFVDRFLLKSDDCLMVSKIITFRPPVYSNYGDVEKLHSIGITMYLLKYMTISVMKSYILPAVLENLKFIVHKTKHFHFNDLCGIRDLRYDTPRVLCILDYYYKALRLTHHSDTISKLIGTLDIILANEENIDTHTYISQNRSHCHPVIKLIHKIKMQPLIDNRNPIEPNDLKLMKVHMRYKPYGAGYYEAKNRWVRAVLV